MGSYWGAAQGQVQIPGQVMSGDAVANPDMEGGDWRTQLQPDSRQRIVTKITEYLKRHLPFSGQELQGLQELEKIAVRCEKKSYTAATSHQDYLRKISLEMEILEAKSQNPIANSLQPNAASNSRNPQDWPGNANGGDRQEEIYQKIKSMNEMYFPELHDTYQRVAAKLQKYDALNPPGPELPENKQLEKLRFLKVMFERFIIFLRMNKTEVQPHHKEKIVVVEKQIINILNATKTRGPLTQPPTHAMQQPQQQHSQISQMHGNEGQMNSLMQQMVGIPSMQTNQQPVHMLQQKNQANMGSMLPNQAQEPQSQIQSMPGLMQQQLGLQQQSNTLPREMQLRVQTYAPLIQQQITIDQQNQLLQSQRPMPEASLTSFDSSSQTGHANGGDWQVEIYQKIKSVNEMYFPELNEMYLRMAAKLQQHDALNPPGPELPVNKQLEKLRFLKVMLERFIIFLHTNKNEVQPHHKEKIVVVEKQIINILNANKPRGPLTQPPTHAMQKPQEQQSQISQFHGNEGQMNS